jgi:hypothetical protein
MSRWASWPALPASYAGAIVSMLTAGAAYPASVPDFSSTAVAWTVGPAYADFIAVPGSPSPVTPVQKGRQIFD